MNQKSRYNVKVLTVVLTVVLAGVISFTAVADGIVLHIAAFRSPGSEATAALIPKFLAANPHIEDIIIHHFSYADLRLKLVSDFIGRVGAFDIVTADCVWMAEFVVGKHLRRLDPFFEDEKLWQEIGMTVEEWDLYDFIPPVLNYLGRFPTLGPTYVGLEHQTQFPLYGIPWLTNTQSLLIRTDLFEKYVAPLGLQLPGITAETAWTIDEFMIAAHALTGTAHSEWGVTLQAKRGNSLVWEISNLMGVFGATYFDENWIPTIETPEWRAMLEFYVGLLGVVAPPEALGWEHAEEAGSLAAGHTAMDLTWNHELNAWVKDPGFSPFYAYFETFWMVLTERGVPPHAPAILGGYFMAIPTAISDERAREAFKFMMWLKSPEIHREYVLLGATPARVSTMYDPVVVERWPWMTVFREVIFTPYTRVNSPMWPMFEYNIAISVSRVMLGVQTIDEALADLQERLHWLAERAGYH